MVHIDKEIKILGISFICDKFYEIKLKYNKQEVVFRVVQISRDRFGNKLSYDKPRALFANGKFICLQIFLNSCDLTTLQICKQKEKSL